MLHGVPCPSPVNRRTAQGQGRVAVKFVCLSPMDIGTNVIARLRCYFLRIDAVIKFPIACHTAKYQTLVEMPAMKSFKAGAFVRV
jgi:hypothetical protein